MTESDGGNNAVRQPVPDDLKNNHVDLLQTGMFSDYTIDCQGHEFKVHRAILKSHSPYFDRLIMGDFKESHEQKATLPEDDPVDVALVIWYIYTGTYPSEISAISALGRFAPCLNNAELTTYCLHARMINAGKRFLIPSLEKLATINVEAELRYVFTPVLSINQDFEQAIQILCECSDWPNRALDVIVMKVVDSLIRGRPTRSSNNEDEKEVIAEPEKETQRQQKLCLQMLMKFAEMDPIFSRLLLKEYAWLCNRDKESCAICNRGIPLGGQTNQNILALQGLKIRWVSCYCHFRGLCTSVCHKADPLLSVKFKYCEPCKLSAEKDLRCALQLDDERGLQPLEGEPIECKRKLRGFIREYERV